MALALNNLKIVDMPLNKETKPNQKTTILLKKIRSSLKMCKICNDENLSGQNDDREKLS